MIEVLVEKSVEVRVLSTAPTNSLRDPEENPL